jgi:hypothetical protein
MPQSNGLTPLGAVGHGILAAAIGTVAMDLYWFVQYKRGGGESALRDWEFSAGLGDWEKASAPAKLGKQLYEGFTQQPLAPRWAALTNNVMHWGYALTWAALFGIVAGSRRSPGAPLGLILGPTVWATSYVVLPLAKVYKPIWEYDLPTLANDLGAHVVYGLGTAAAFGALADC